MRKPILVLAGLFTFALTANRAEAAKWYMAGSGCTVDRTNVADYQQFGVGVEFSPGRTGTIRLYCPVTVGERILEGTGYVRDLYYQDEDATSLGANVRAEFFKMRFQTGAVTSVEGCEVIESSAGGTATGYNTRSDTCTHNFDPDTYLYFIRVLLSRNTPNISVRLYGSSIFGGPQP